MTFLCWQEHEVHTLKCGTQVIQTRKFSGQTVKAVVIRTGFLTTKGDLVRSILYPPPVDFKFEKDSYKFIMVLTTIAFIGMAYTLAKMVIDEETISSIILEVFDLITIVVPPALPAAMTIGIVIAQQRLRKAGIFCISPRSINIAGTVNCVCFDKTGTITEDGMDMWGVVPAKAGLESVLAEPNKLGGGGPELAEPRRRVTDLGTDTRMLVGMAVCHELNVIAGEVMGDPLDEKIFESTSWSLELAGEEQSQGVSVFAKDGRGRRLGSVGCSGAQLAICKRGGAIFKIGPLNYAFSGHPKAKYEKMIANI